tara:strand:- start:300 stop:533 length:234 start_codon:yes stop_codon:yes gene_type:complete
MKVKELIKILQTYTNPEEQIIAQWYTKEDVDNWFEDENTVTTKQWEEVVERYSYNSCQQFGDDISEQLQEIMEEDNE